MTTLLQICQNVLNENGQFNVPDTIVGNTDPAAVQLLALANRAGRSIAYDNTWQILSKSYTFPTNDGTENYALPSDFYAFINMTYWNRTTYREMVGPVSAAFWEMLKSGNFAAAGINLYFRIYGNLFYIYPTPTSADTIAYQYKSSQWISGKTEFSVDADVPLIDADLITLGVRWRFLASKGLRENAADAKAEYDARLASLLEKDGGKDVISFSRSVVDLTRDNIPDTGFGL